MKFYLTYENFVDIQMIDKYKALAKIILSKNKVSREEFKQALKEMSTID